MRPRLKRRGLFGSVSSFPTDNSILKEGVLTVVNNFETLTPYRDSVIFSRTFFSSHLTPSFEK